MNYKEILFNENKFIANCNKLNTYLEVFCESCYIRYLKSENYLRGLALNNADDVYFKDFDDELVDRCVKYIRATLKSDNKVYFKILFSSHVFNLSFEQFTKLFNLAANGWINIVLDYHFDDINKVRTFTLGGIYYIVEKDVHVDKVDSDLWRLLHMPLFNRLKKKPVLYNGDKDYITINLNDMNNYKEFNFGELTGDKRVVGIMGHETLLNMKDMPLFCDVIVLSRDGNYMPYPAALLYDTLRKMYEAKDDLVVAIQDGRTDILTYMKHIFKDINKKLVLF